MNYFAVLGILFSLFSIVVGNQIEGGSYVSLLSWVAFMIVVGGAYGAVFFQFPIEVIKLSLKQLKEVFLKPKFNFDDAIDEIVFWSEKVKQGGTMELETFAESIEDSFIRDLVQQVADGEDKNEIEATANKRLDAQEYFAMQGAKVWESIGGYTPTFGIIGAVMGLIIVMGNLGDPAKIGSGIATAFIATIYGVGMANIFFIPLSSHIKYIINKEMEIKRMYLEGLLSIGNSENPRVTKKRIESFRYGDSKTVTEE